MSMNSLYVLKNSFMVPKSNLTLHCISRFFLIVLVSVVSYFTYMSAFLNFIEDGLDVFVFHHKRFDLLLRKDGLFSCSF